MPTYVYECAKCGDEVEIWQSFKDDPLKRHPTCGGKLTKVYQPVGIVLKGPGFYKTDSRNGKKAATSGSDRSESSSDSGSSESKSEKSDSKSESKSDSKSGSKSDSKKSAKAPSKSASKSS